MVYQKSLIGLTFTEEQLEELAELSLKKETDKIGFSFSDIRLKVLPEAVAKAFPNNPLTFEIIKETIISINPSPEII